MLGSYSERVKYLVFLPAYICSTGTLPLLCISLTNMPQADAFLTPLINGELLISISNPSLVLFQICYEQVMETNQLVPIPPPIQCPLHLQFPWVFASFLRLLPWLFPWLLWRARRLENLVEPPLEDAFPRHILDNINTSTDSPRKKNGLW